VNDMSFCKSWFTGSPSWRCHHHHHHHHLLLLLLPHLLLLLLKRYNLCKVLACSTTFFQLSLFCAPFFQLRTFMFFVSSKTSSSHCVLGLPVGLLDICFHLLILYTILSSAMRSTWPNQFSLCFLINPIIFCPFSISKQSIYIFI
jgi:hypothetical protein